MGTSCAIFALTAPRLCERTSTARCVACSPATDVFVLGRYSHALVCLSCPVPLDEGEAPVRAMRWAYSVSLPSTSHRKPVDLIRPVMEGLEAALFGVNVMPSSRHKEICGPIVWAEQKWVIGWLLEAQFWSLYIRLCASVIWMYYSHCWRVFHAKPCVMFCGCDLKE